ncbi:MAG: MMPL family transporter [Ktedonobacteraceae bacterium]|nr:MMPL family transporter [Ktedonobacteraceae bacterium]
MRYGQFIYDIRWVIVMLWIAAILPSIPFSQLVSTGLHNSGYTISGSEYNRVDQVLTSRLHQPTNYIQIVFQSSTSPVDSPAYQQEVQTVMRQVQTVPHAISVTAGPVGRDKRTTVVQVGFDEDNDTVAQQVPSLRKLLSHLPIGPARILLTGEPVVTDELPKDVETVSEAAKSVALPLTFIVLLIVFGTLWAALIPVMLALITLSVASAIIYGFAMFADMNIFVLNVVSIIGLGLSIDYSLLMVRRFREELARGHAVPEAIAIVMATAGEAIFHSGMVVIIGFAGLLFIGIGLTTSFGIGGMAATSVTLLAALTLLPALLSILGKRINALRLPLLTQRNNHLQSSESRAEPRMFWQRWALLVMKRPIVIIVLATALLLALGWPALALNPRLPDASTLPADSQAYRGLEVLRSQYPLANQDPIVVIVQTPDGSHMLDEAQLVRIQNITQWISTQPHVANVISLTQPDSTEVTSQQLIYLYTTGIYQRIPELAQFVAATTNNDTTVMLVKTDALLGSNAEQTLIHQLRSMSPAIKQNLHILVGGLRAANLDFNDVLYGHFFFALLFILLATYVLLLFTFRSVLLPLKAILMDIISISAAYGALVFVFQQGHFDRLLNFTSPGFIICFTPILMFCILFGLSMDYEVFLLTRMREEWLRIHDNSTAVALGLEKTGSMITNAALLFVIVSGSFIFTSLIATKELGLGVTVSVLVDATIIRCLLVPATMQLLGNLNWWFPYWKRKNDSNNDILTTKIHCTNCSAVLPSHANFCSSCGMMLETTLKLQTVQRQRRVN